MNKRMIVLSALVLLSVGILLLLSLRSSGKPPAQTKNEAGGEVTGTTEEGKVAGGFFWKETANLSENSRMLVIPIYYHPTKKDPMQPAFTSAEAGPAFKLMIKEGASASASSLTGILLGNSRRGAAIINEKIYRVGDMVDGKKIVAIERNRVILRKGTDEEILRLENN